MLVGCTAMPNARTQPPVVPAVASDELPKSWWRVSAKIVWPEEQEVRWYVDDYMAHQIYAPLLTRYRQHINLWRFHRRAARDGAGHRFTFFFFAPKDSAKAIFAELQADPLLEELMQQNLVSKIQMSDIDNPKQRLVRENADPKWSLPVQKTWPYFSMGVSQMWLGLVQEYVAEAANQPQESLQQTMDLYKQVEQKVRDTWTHEGGHALLHHLNALFGYEEIVIYERRVTRF
jgi:hypothetical protein